MDKKDIKRLGLVFGVILLAAMGMDMSESVLTENGAILRNDIGEGEKEINLMLDIDGIGEDYEYALNVEPIRPTRERAMEYFAAAIEEIEGDFKTVQEAVPIKGEYSEGIVEAEWDLEPWNVIDADGTVIQEKIPEDGLIVSANVTLYCGEYEQIYQFSFNLEKKELSQEEKIFAALEEWRAAEMQKEGEMEIYLPEKLAGVELYWSVKKESITLGILVLEGIALVLLIVAQRQKKEQERKTLVRNLELDYPEIVGQLTLLLGAGMNTRQAWHKIATRYLDKREKGQIRKKDAYEGIVRMNRRMQEGENEKTAFQQFANETKNMKYHRLIRLLVSNLEKGAKDICEILEQESKQAYEQRVLQAKKLGEEASTHMLLPLLLMMIVVMAIVMLPAIFSFVR